MLLCLNRLLILKWFILLYMSWILWICNSFFQKLVVLVVTEGKQSQLWVVRAPAFILNSWYKLFYAVWTSSQWCDSHFAMQNINGASSCIFWEWLWWWGVNSHGKPTNTKIKLLNLKRNVKQGFSANFF